MSSPAGLYDVARRKMVEQQLRDIVDPRVRAAMAEVPRHEFVEPVLQPRAYDDGPLPIARRQTISQPRIVARMTELLELSGDENVLEIGTGSGYQAAVLSRLARRVISLERHADLAQASRKRLESLGFRNVTVLPGDGTLGRSEFAPYEAILVTAASPSVPPPLLDQLALGGRLVIPVGDEDTQRLVQVRRGESGPDERRFEACRFVPLLGRFGWKDAV
jgi:protein-L-isoaspartate(D-aspartate) O-methyltransferase